MALKIIYCFLLFSLASLGFGNPVENAPVIKKVLIIGATGLAGSKIVTEAIDRGIQVRAFSRNPSKSSQDVKDKVETVAGDILNYDDIQKAVRGVDAVIVAISPKSLYETNKQNLYMTKGLQNILKAMKAENVELVHVLLSIFIYLPNEELPSEAYKIEKEDQLAMIEVLKKSDVKYIASFPPNFLETPYDEYEVAIGVLPGGKNINGGINVISLNQLGKFIIDSLSKPEYYRKLIGVRNKVHIKE